MVRSGLFRMSCRQYVCVFLYLPDSCLGSCVCVSPCLSVYLAPLSVVSGLPCLSGLSSCCGRTGMYGRSGRVSLVLSELVCSVVAYCGQGLASSCVVCPSACLSADRLLSRPSVCQTVGLSVCRSVGVPVCLSVCLPVCLPACLSVCLSVGLSSRGAVKLSSCLPVCLQASLAACTPARLLACQLPACQRDCLPARLPLPAQTRPVCQGLVWPVCLVCPPVQFVWSV